MRKTTSSAKSTKAETKPVRTTTLRITPPKDYSQLSERFQLVRFELPPGLGYGDVKGNFARVHNAMKDSLDAPYRLFTNDKVGNDTRWVVYALYLVQEDTVSYTVPFEDTTLTGQPSKFEIIPYHVLIKLLQVRYFWESVKSPERFIGQDKCFIQVMKDKKKEDHYLCLEMEIKGTPNAADHLFYVDEHAHYFGRVDKEEAVKWMQRFYYYAQVNAPGDRLIAFRQLKHSEIETTTKTLFTLRQYDTSRPTLDYHTVDPDELENTRGYHLYHFIDGFTEFLTPFNFQVDALSRNFGEYVDKTTEEFNLPIEKLETVYILDVRFARAEIPLDLFLKPYHDAHPSLGYRKITDLAEIPQGVNPPVLIFQDAEKDAFVEGMPMYGPDQTDPYPEIYRSYPHIPKQFVNVNDNDLEGWSAPDQETGKRTKLPLSKEAYLKYPLPGTDKKSKDREQQKATVVMNELFMKYLILSNCPIADTLPNFPTGWMFIHFERRKIQNNELTPFKFAMKVGEQSELTFLDWYKADKATFYDILDDWEVTDAFEAARHKDRYPEDNKEPGERPQLDIIVGPRLCLRLDVLPESVMYDYELLSERSKVNTEPRLIGNLKLLPHFDTLRPEGSPSRENIEMFWRSPGATSGPVTKPSKKAVGMYDKFIAYDNLLDKLPVEHSISLTKLKQMLKDVKDSDDGESLAIGSRELTNYYDRVGLFGSMRSEEMTSIYQGIWYTSDHHFVIGDTNGMQTEQARAHLVRHVHVEQSAPDFSMESLLGLMSVTFIRLNQFTVTPYPFHLIDLYIDNVIRHRSEDSSSIGDTPSEQNELS